MKHDDDAMTGGPLSGRPEATADETAAEGGLDRRQFLGGVGGVTAGALAGGLGGLGGLAAAGRAEAHEIAPLPGDERKNRAFKIRHDAAIREKQRPLVTTSCNGDEERFPNRIGNYSKCLPHDATTGEVAPAAYQQLLAALATDDFAAYSALPMAGTFRLANPMGGLGFNLIGPDNRPVSAPPPPTVDSAELAAQAAELYWMQVLRDVPFFDWDTDPLVQEACDDLSAMPGYTGPRDPGSGDVTPQELFRVDFPGVTTGPIVSQFLMRGFNYDGIFVQEPKIQTVLPGAEQNFLTSKPEWIASRNGFPAGSPGFSGAFDPVFRYPRSVRDLGHIAGQDVIYSTYFRAVMIFRLSFGGALMDQNYLYRTTPGHFGFATLGFGDFVVDLAAACQGERPTWYSKWQLHRFLRPEEYGGLVHRLLAEGADYPIHPSLLASPVLGKVFDLNKASNQARGQGSDGSYFLGQMFRQGCPTHPSYPAGHAFTAGASVTVLKAWWNEDIGFPGPRQPTADGTTFVAYPGALSIGGELNKLAYNLSFGRDMSGVHWRVDDVAGLLQGEEFAIRHLSEKVRTYPEPFAGFTLRKFEGTQIVITGDGPVPA